MEYSLSTLSVVIDFFKKLWDELKVFQRKEKVRKELFQALSFEIEMYLNSFESMGKIGEERVIPLLQHAAKNPSQPKIVQIINSITDLQITYSKLIESFVKLAKGCKDVSSYEAFMEHLKEADSMLFDFVNVMAKTAKDDMVLIDSRFYRFIKMYGNEITKELKIEQVENAVKELKFYIDVVNKHVKPFIRKSLIPKKTLKHFIDSYKKLSSTSRKIKVRKTEIINIRQYVPLKLLPIIVLIEEASTSLK
ncbi:MAG: hypothetical protein ACKD6O_08220 [Candidatus Bathyarchaeota archaeon]